MTQIDERTVVITTRIVDSNTVTVTGYDCFVPLNVLEQIVQDGHRVAVDTGHGEPALVRWIDTGYLRTIADDDTTNNLAEIELAFADDGDRLGEITNPADDVNVCSIPVLGQKHVETVRTRVDDDDDEDVDPVSVAF